MFCPMAVFISRARILWTNSKNPTNNFADYTPTLIREQQYEHFAPTPPMNGPGHLTVCFRNNPLVE